MNAAMNASMNAATAVHRTGWIEWFRREMAAFPDRKAMTVRMVAGVLLVTIISMALQVPQLTLSAFFVIFVTKENRTLTTLTGIIMVLGVTIATALSLFASRFTFDHPELRLPVLGVCVFTGMFLSRVFVIGPLGFVIGFFSGFMLIITEYAPNTEALVRGQLWLWVAIVYPIVLTVVLNQILLPAHPWAAFVRSLTQRIDAATTTLRRTLKDGHAGGQVSFELLELATRGSSPLYGLLNFAEKEAKHFDLKPNHARWVATIAASEHLITATASLELRELHPLSENDITCANTLVTDLEEIRTALQEPNPVLPPAHYLRFTADLPQLREVQFATRSFHDSLIGENPGQAIFQSKPAKKSLFVPDAFTNPVYTRFALKVTFAAMICYLIYTGLDWPGIQTAFITCCFIALGNTGATVRKGWLRFIGCCVGGLLGFLSIVFLVPHMVSITSLVFLTAVGSALAGWVAAGTERVSYAGLQGAFAFYYCIFQGYEPDTNFTTIRDRVVGILLGITVSGIVFHYIWPEHASDGLRATLARVLRNLSKLVLLPKTGEPLQAEEEAADKAQGAITTDLDNALRLSELTVFENAKTDRTSARSPAELQALASHTQALCLMTTALLRKTKLEEWEQQEPPVQQAETTLRQSAAEQLQHIATCLETGRPSEPSNLEATYAAWKETVARCTENDRPRLVRHLIEQIQQFN